jgi:outer membrane receptor protein involved in Fe transport
LRRARSSPGPLRSRRRQWDHDGQAYTTTDLSTGIRRDNWKLDFFLDNAFDERTELAASPSAPRWCAASSRTR